MIKKLAAVSLTVLMAASFAAGCAKKEAPQQSAAPAPAGNKQEAAAPKTGGTFEPKELRVQFVPSQQAETLEAKAKPLEKLLSDKLGIPVKVSVSTNYNTVIEAMASKQVDIGFLPPTNYVVAHDDKKAADLLLQAQRFGVDDKTGQPTTELVDYYKSMIIVKADSPIKELKDLKGKKMAWQDVTSSAGYVYPAILMKKNGIDPDKDVTGITVKGHDKGVLAVLNGDVDAAAVFQDIRTQMKDVPDAVQKTRVLSFTDKIPNDTISVRPDMSQAWRDKISQAFIDLGKNDDSRKILVDIYSHQGYVKGDDKNFDIVRQAAKDIGQKK
ncbi:phosphate/phosphite/phosphonate ABC transporter substrate-binding protein [Paenibacillus thalictri]|uniref:Phosphate/phosphite/phosphonate ABC transporter substrate-binding protein n=1 Tax=Paenibacillus thalictri TaxID=2527873 RepID=A0A4Q9DI66_9BACL|nr:phosphate/phosphite/phosphonate ABC transporter substrate-binding protein [Paenibacillus thalictri]TBL71345.1 phosphate/phosphite/phosphonate ABC transporter substrate-binding protein [Paenibacillus thalictri]